MSNRRGLVSRGQMHGNSTATPNQRRRQEENREPEALPPYEPPTCQLTQQGRRALKELREHYDYSKYQKHVKESKKLIPLVIGEYNDRLYMKKERARKAAERRRRQGRDESDKTEQEIEEEGATKGFKKNAERETEKAEKAMRDLIDYSDELAMHETLFGEVTEPLDEAPLPRPPPERRPRERRPRNDDSDEGEEEALEEEEDLEPEGPVLSARDLLQKARDNYINEYTSRTMLERYENNDYKGFKSAVHSALHPNGDDPPLPRPSKWFPQDRARSQGDANAADEGSEESDEDVYISGAKIDFKCPLTLQPLEEPYTNKKCNHTFEKERIIEYINAEGVQFTQSQAHGPRQPEKQVKCIQIGCENMLKLADFYDDNEILRQIKRSNRQAELDIEDDEDDQLPRGTERNRPESVDEEESGNEAPEQTIRRIKAERQSQAFG